MGWRRYLLAGAVLLSGCGGRQSTLDTHSPQTHDIAVLWWWMLGIASVVFFGAVGLLALAWLRRRTPGLPVVGENEGINRNLVLTFGIAIPIVVLVTLFLVANVTVLGATAAPRPGSTAMTIRVVGHQWFWEIRYPGTAAVTANEIHIPTRTRVNVVAATGDVIHSLWVPELNRKVDTVPGRANRILLYADKPGTYRGQCSEFCGLQHAHMALQVVAEAPAQYRAWLANMARPARAPATPQQTAGRATFLATTCSSCHAIRGTEARADVGPDLTHVATRATLASDTIPNTPAELLGWISDPQHVKPGAKMPGLSLTPAQFREIAAYLESLR
jgi:cytochrome c oxidase subunit 2